MEYVLTHLVSVGISVRPGVTLNLNQHEKAGVMLQLLVDTSFWFNDFFLQLFFLPFDRSEGKYQITACQNHKGCSRGFLVTRGGYGTFTNSPSY